MLLRKMLWTVSFLVIAAAVGGCGSEVGNDGDVVGGGCVVSSECAPQSVCRTGESWPGGYCANGCDSDEDCLDGSRCVAEEGGICVVECASDAECRSEDESYACLTRNARGAAGTVMACATDD